VTTALLGNLLALDYGLMAVYLVCMVLIGVWFSRSGGNTENYLLGGRAMPWWAIGVSYVVSLLSTLTLVGVPGEAYTHGIDMAIGSILLPIFSIAAFHIFVRFYFLTRLFTPFDYLERRYSPAVRAAGAGFFWLSRAIYIGLVLYASARVFVGAADWPVWITILLVGIIGTGYTIVGGLKAVVWTDFVQFIVLTGGVALIVGWAIAEVPGGAAGVINYAFEHGRGANALATGAFYSFDPMVRVTLWGLIIVILNEQLFFNSSDQIALQRLLSTSGYRQARRSIFTFAALITPVLLILWFLGLAIFSFYGQRPIEQRPQQGDLALFHFMATELPTPVPGLILAAMLAAIMSTLDSGINSLATVATKDFYHRFFRPGASERTQVRFSQWMTLLTGMLAIGIGLGLDAVSEQTGATVLETTQAWLALSVALPPVFLLGMLSRRATPAVAMIQLLVGWSVTAAMLVWYLLSKHGGGSFSFMYVGLPGPALSLLIGYGLSRLQPRQSPARLAQLTVWTRGIDVTG
jgi:SSS family transporter